MIVTLDIWNIHFKPHLFHLCNKTIWWKRFNNLKITNTWQLQALNEQWSCLPNNKSLSSRLASRLSLRNCLSISALIRLFSLSSGDMNMGQQSIFWCWFSLWQYLQKTYSVSYLYVCYCTLLLHSLNYLQRSLWDIRLFKSFEDVFDSEFYQWLKFSQYP